MSTVRSQACFNLLRPLPVKPVASRFPLGALGLIVVGDYALATGADRHVAFAASVVGKANQSLAWAWIIPSDRAQLASALDEAWQRPLAVACFGGLGNGVDDCVRITINALQAGREQVGLSRHAETEIDGVRICANIAFFSGHPRIAHPAFERWWGAVRLTGNGTALATERIHWKLPESTQAIEARRKVKSDYPTVAQRLAAAGDGEVMLTFTGASKGKAQGARKALQRALAARGST